MNVKDDNNQECKHVYYTENIWCHLANVVQYTK